MTTTEPQTTIPKETAYVSVGGSIPIWIDENTGQAVKEDIYSQKDGGIYSEAIENGKYEYITDNRSIYINPKTYYYYTGNHPKSIIPTAYNDALIDKNQNKANRIHQINPIDRYLMLSNRAFMGTLNPITTQPPPAKATYSPITIVSEALNTNNNNLYEQRYNIIETQENLNTLTNKLNNLKLKLSSIKQKPMYSAGGSLTFY